MYNCMEFDANRRIITRTVEIPNSNKSIPYHTITILYDSYAICLELCDYSIVVGIMRKIMLA